LSSSGRQDFIVLAYLITRGLRVIGKRFEAGNHRRSPDVRTLLKKDFGFRRVSGG
jgi:hypothetical protein